MAKLTAAERDALPASAFVFPGSRQYPIQDLDHARNALARSAGKPENVAVKAAVYKKYPALKKAEPVEKASNLLIDKAQQIVYGVVLTPGVEDSQGDIISAEEIEKAAHRWLVEYRKQDVQHSEIAKGADGRPLAEPVESFCAPCDLTIEGEPVKKGAWVIATRVNDPATWDEVVAGRRTGFSIGGSGVREAIADTA